MVEFAYSTRRVIDIEHGRGLVFREIDVPIAAIIDEASPRRTILPVRNCLAHHVPVKRSSGMVAWAAWRTRARAAA